MIVIDSSVLLKEIVLLRAFSKNLHSKRVGRPHNLTLMRENNAENVENFLDGGYVTNVICTVPEWLQSHPRSIELKSN